MVEFRDPATLEWLQGVFPPFLAEVAAVVTRLGDPPLIAALAIGVYWLGPRGDVITGEDADRLLGVVLGGLALITALKWAFALPRPPAALTLLEADGYGFPSGHALGSTVGYGALAAYLLIGTRRHRFILAGCLALAIAASRVVLAVHYPIDVVVGVLLGAAYLVTAMRLGRTETIRTIALPVVFGVLAGIAAWPTIDGTTAAGIGIGVGVGYLLRGPERAEPGTMLMLGIGSLGAMVGWGIKSVQPVAPLVFAAAILGGVAIAVVPGLSGRRTLRTGKT